MLFISFLRTIKFSFQDMVRNIWLTLVTIIIIILALFSINILITVNVISEAAIDSVKKKIDISLYLNPEAEENQILALKAKVSNLDNVREVEYISSASALDIFREKHKYNPEILEALRELGKNPLTPILIIKPKNVENYNTLIKTLNNLENQIIESKNFDDYKSILNKINSISTKVRQAGIFLSGIFIFVTLLVVYNAIRVAIYTHRKEIAIMRLVGASGWFIKAPYLISGIFYAFFGIIFIILVFYPFLNLLQPYLEAFFIDYQINIVSYFNQNFVIIFGLQFLGAVFINIFASLIAVGKYSKV